MTAKTSLERNSAVRMPELGKSYWLVGIIVGVALIPIFSLFAITTQGNFEDLSHLAQTVLPTSLKTTAILMTVVAVLTASIGVTCAWLVTSFEFPFRRTLSWLLVLPIAIPPYIAAYCFVDAFHFVGPVQTFIRSAFGFQGRADYWFPEIRNVWGAGFILSLTLYPYVYLATRVVFIMQGRNAADVARLLGASKSRVFFKVQLPMARPAIVAGVSLVLMETLNDIGASEYLGVPTLTFSIFNTWLGRGSLAGAAQLAIVMLVLVAFLLWLELYSRRMLRFHSGQSSQMKARPARIALSRISALAVFGVCAAPVLIGFGIPLIVLLEFALKRHYQIFDVSFVLALKNSILVGVLSAIFVVSICLCLLHLTLLMSGTKRMLARLANVGYALPGTVLSLGLLYFLTTIDTGLNLVTRSLFGVPVGLVFSGSLFAVILACSIRFIAVGESSLTSALSKLPPNLDAAARNLGRAPFAASRDALLPLLRPAIVTSFILVFVDTVKELSATILLRPIGFNTLATYVYENASRAAVEDGAVAALAIVAISLVPIVVLSRTLAGDRA